MTGIQLAGYGCADITQLFFLTQKELDTRVLKVKYDIMKLEVKQ